MIADHQNKADIASSRARAWFDEQKIDMLIGGTNSATALAMAAVAREKKKPFMAIGLGSSNLTNSQCSPYTIHYAYDTIALARGTGSAIVAEGRSEEHTSELQSLMRISFAVFCLKKKKPHTT